MIFPAQAPLKRLSQQHQEFTLFYTAWESIRLLYEGGSVLKKAVIHLGWFLIQAPKELPEVFAIRQQRFSYANLLGNVIGWYCSALFKEAIAILMRQEGAKGEDSLKIPQQTADFCADFEKDCDRGGTSYNEFFKSVAETLLLYRSAYVLIDLPAPDGDVMPASLFQQRASGALSPYLVMYRPNNIINWETDQYGNLTWAIVYMRLQEQKGFLDAPVTTDYWYCFDREQVALYSRPVKEGATSSVSGEEMADLSAGYPRPHAMTDQKRVPIRRIELPEGLWLANRVLLPLVNHLNQDNALDFGLFQANLPQLVIMDGKDGRGYEEANEQPTISPVGYHKVANGGEMYFLEPEGKAFDASQKRLDVLEERIYKACYLMAQARSNRSTPTAQSGVSKQQDQAPSRDALSGIGDVIRPAMQSVYGDVLQIGGYEDIEPDVRGMDFSDRASSEEMDLLEQSSVIQVQSPRFERELQKKNVALTFPDINPETRDFIYAEIDAAPTPSEEAAAQQEAQQASQLAQFQASLKAATAPESLAA